MTAAASGVSIDPARGVVRVRPGTGTMADAATRGRLLGRIFACPHVHRVDVGRSAAVIDVHVDLDSAPLGAALSAVGRALREERRVAIPRDGAERVPVTIRRVGGLLTTWRVDAEAADRLRFSHRRLRRDRVLARRVERFALRVPGVLDVRTTAWRGDLVVRFDAPRFDAVELLTGLQREVDERVAARATSPWEMAGTSATLGVAATADFAVSALAPVSAVLLVGTNLRTLGAAAAELRRGRIGMPTVASAIVLGTLATGQFLASGIMAWSFDFWRRRHRRDVEAERQLLIEDVVPVPAAVSVSGGSRPGAVQGTIAEDDGARGVAEGDVVPVDGRIVAGGGVIDDRAVSGTGGARSVGTGDAVPAGAVLLGGRLTILAERPLGASRLAAVGRMLEEATTWSPGRMAPTRHGEAFGEKFAVPTLATAGLGLLAGDVTTAVAVMRPDYANAEAISVSFEDLDAVARGLVEGCVVRAPRGLDALASVDALVILDHPRLRRCGLRVSRVVCGSPEAVGRPSDAQAEAIRWAASLAAHIADDRRDALAALAATRGCALLDVVPDAFGDERGLAIVCRRGDRGIILHEVAPSGDQSVRPLVLEVGGHPVATFEFQLTAERVATAAIDRLRDGRAIQVLLAAEDDALDPAGLAAELHCDGVLVANGRSLADQVGALVHAGRRVACAAAGPLPAGLAGLAAVTIHLGDVADAGVADIVVLSGDVGRIPDLVHSAEQRRRRMSRTRRMTILPNVLCVAGAFTLGFTSLVAVIVSNLGTFGAYRQASRALADDRRRSWVRARPVARRRLS